MSIQDRIRSTVYNWLMKGTGMNTTIDDRDEKRVMSLIATARNYYKGDQVVYLTPRQKEFLGMHENTDLAFVFNHCQTVIDAVGERLKVTGFDFGGDEPLSSLVWNWWDANRYDAAQMEVHRDTMVSGECFVMSVWDAEENRPQWIIHPRFVSRSAGGDDYGMVMEYPNNNPFLQPIRAIKMWEELDNRGQILQRRTYYYPDRIEKVAYQEGKWQEYRDESDVAWPIPWVGADGKPLGIPVAHFKTPLMLSDLKKVIPIQDAENKQWLDILAAGDATAFRTLITYGWRPTTDGDMPKADGSNLIRISPGHIISTLKTAAEASTQVIDPGDLTALLEVEEKLVLTLARVTGTPVSRFQTTRQVAAEGTLKQQEGPLLSKVEARQTLFGNAWEDLVKVSVRMAQMYGNGIPEVVGKQVVTLSTKWGNAEVRDEQAQKTIADTYKAIGAPLEFILQELGVPQEKITEIMGSDEVKMRMENMALAGEMLRAQQNGGDNNGGSFPGNRGAA